MIKYLPDKNTSNINDFRPFAGVRLVVMDLDGTLVESGSSLLNEITSRLINGIHLTIATGRALAGSLQILEALRISQNTPIILYNGSLVVTKGDFVPIHRCLIAPNSLDSIVSSCRSLGARVLAYYFGAEGARWFGPVERVIGWSTGDTFAREINGLTVEWTEDPPGNLVDVDPDGPVAVLVDQSARPLHDLRNVLGAIPGITITGSGSRYIEIRPLGSDKGVALDVAARHLGVSLQDIVALGDNDNDAEMLVNAGIGISVAGASKLAQESSNYQCKGGAVSAAAETLRLVKIARRYTAAVQMAQDIKE